MNVIIQPYNTHIIIDQNNFHTIDEAEDDNDDNDDYRHNEFTTGRRTEDDRLKQTSNIT